MQPLSIAKESTLRYENIFLDSLKVILLCTYESKYSIVADFWQQIQTADNLT